MATASRAEQFMQRALALAVQADGRTHPNPMVGAVVVRRGTIVGEGFHRRAGTPHAEVHALRAAGKLARGADLYVTLEPCCHHGRTPPCVEAILAAGIRRVIYAMRDPNPDVAGNGLAQLRRAGVIVEGPLCETAARRLNRIYCHWRTTGAPYVILKVASTLDGKMADASGRSQWITNAAVRAYTHQWRARVDAMLVGRTTLLRDDPSLTVRLPGYRGTQPIPIVWIGQAKIPWNAALLQQNKRPVWLIVERATPQIAARVARSGHVVIEGRTVQECLRTLGALGISALLLEGGAHTIGAFLRAHAIQYAIVGMAPLLLGSKGLTWSGDFSTTLPRAASLAVEQLQQFGDNIVVEGIVNCSAARPPSRKGSI